MNRRTLILILLVGLIHFGCSDKATDGPTDAEPEISKLNGDGGRVAVYTGGAHTRILFDRVTDPTSGNTDLFIMNSNGTDVRCLTCNIPHITDRFTGQPAWHPDGVHCVIQVENGNSNHTVFEHMSFGINNDLWLLNTQTLQVSKLFSTELNHAALHPHFAADGSKLIFSYRVPTGVVFPGLIGVTPGGENHWDGWAMYVADFSLAGDSTFRLSNPSILRPNGTGFYEAHHVGHDIVYSFTPQGYGYVDDCYRCDLSGHNVVNLTASPTTWEEHASYSPSGQNFVFISSRHDGSWSYPGSTASEVSTELYLCNVATGAISQLTYFNHADSSSRYLTSDFDWTSDGDRIIFLLAIRNDTDGSTTNEIWEIQFTEPK